MTPSPTTRINISLSEDVLSILKRYVPKRGLSRFLAEAANEKIMKIKREKALRILSSASPTFTHIPNASLYVHALRRESEKRSKRLGI